MSLLPLLLRSVGKYFACVGGRVLGGGGGMADWWYWPIIKLLKQGGGGLQVGTRAFPKPHPPIPMAMLLQSEKVGLSYCRSIFGI